MKISLTILRDGHSPKAFPMKSSVTIIGRRKDCDMQIPLMLVSRRHAQLHVEDNNLILRDLNSSNGTFLNGEKISETTVNPGDFIKIGPIDFFVQIDDMPEQVPQKAPDSLASPAPAKDNEAEANAQQFASLDEPAEFDDLELPSNRSATEIADVFEDVPAGPASDDSLKI
jgi:pSer/pThr/pTyr-binding forkhead associated (FHA) protein